MKKLALFDMDGTLFDTSEVNYLSYQAAAMELGFQIERDKFMEVFVGKNYKDFLPLFGITDAGLLQQIHERKKELYPQFLSHAKLNIFLADIINNLPNEYKKVLVTTASRKNTIDILSSFHLDQAFDFCITQEDAAKLKPDPEAFIMAMERTGIPAENTVIFEDSQVGIQAAKACGAAVFQIRSF